jgi:hypothetical protein
MAFTVGIAGITGKFARSVAHHLLKRTDVSVVSAGIRASSPISFLRQLEYILPRANSAIMRHCVLSLKAAMW